MASKSATNNETPNTTKPAKKRSKKLSLRAPFVKLEEGMSISGTIVLFTRTEGGKFGSKDVVQIQLDEPLSWPGKTAGARDSAKAGDTVNVEIKPGMAGIKSLGEGTNVTIDVVGRVDVGKGNPAWSFEVTYD